MSVVLLLTGLGILNAGLMPGSEQFARLKDIVSVLLGIHSHAGESVCNLLVLLWTMPSVLSGRQEDLRRSSSGFEMGTEDFKYWLPSFLESFRWCSHVMGAEEKPEMYVVPLQAQA